MANLKSAEKKTKAQAMGMNPDLMANAIEGAKYLKS